ncbi:MAG: hypothetical protein IVW57_09515 [Ktedonobacterales bacterium]|nr:hypothetical protein [Ktedonobacterales bacterium]
MALLLLVSSLASFGLGQAARHLTSALTLPLPFSRLLTHEATGALGAPLPPVTRASTRPTVYHAVSHRQAKARATATRRSAKSAAGNSVPPCGQNTSQSTVSAMSLATTDGQTHLTVTICVSTGATTNTPLPGQRPDAPGIVTPPIAVSQALAATLPQYGTVPHHPTVMGAYPPPISGGVAYPPPTPPPGIPDGLAPYGLAP